MAHQHGGAPQEPRQTLGGNACLRVIRRRRATGSGRLAVPQPTAPPVGQLGECDMDIPLDLLSNAIIAGLLLGGFYAAVTAGVSISFGMLDIVNIAHPAFIILGSYVAYIINATTGADPIAVAVVMLPLFYLLGTVIYQVYYAA